MMKLIGKKIELWMHVEKSPRGPTTVERILPCYQHDNGRRHRGEASLIYCFTAQCNGTIRAKALENSSTASGAIFA